MRRESLNTKILILTISLFVICSLFYGIFFSNQSQKALMNEFINRGNSLVENLALNAGLDILIENKNALSKLAENLLQEKDVQEVKIMNENKEILVHLSKPDQVEKGYREILSLPVVMGRDKYISDRFSLFPERGDIPFPGVEVKEVIGFIEVVFSKKSITDTIAIMRRNMFILAVIATTIGCMFALYFSNSIVRPLRRLAEATTRIAQGNWETTLPIDSFDEVGQLTDAFNKMSASLITKKRELEETYRELARRERMAEIGNFSMMIAHELKNPLGIIKGAVDIIAKDGVKAKVRKTMTEYIQDEVKRLNRLVEDFLSFARPNPTHKSMVDINQLITKIATLVPLPEAQEKSCSIKIQLDSDILSVNADENQIYQAILNLLSNAIHATPQEGEIILKTERSSKGVSISIADSGTGIPEADKAKIFEPFFTTKERGTGLGLAIVKKIVDAHQGEITVANREGGGTIFTLWLPEH